MPRQNRTDRLAFMVGAGVFGAGLLSLGAVGLWSVKLIWPSLTLADRMIFLCSLLAGVVSLPWVFYMEVSGRPPFGARTWATVHIASIVLPITGVAWALNHGGASLAVLAMMPWSWKNAVRRFDARTDRIYERWQ